MDASLLANLFAEASDAHTRVQGQGLSALHEACKSADLPRTLTHVPDMLQSPLPSGADSVRRAAIEWHEHGGEYELAQAAQLYLRAATVAVQEGSSEDDAAVMNLWLARSRCLDPKRDSQEATLPTPRVIFRLPLTQVLLQVILSTTKALPGVDHDATVKSELLAMRGMAKEALTCIEEAVRDYRDAEKLRAGKSEVHHAGQG